jgi:hypothetical protein
MGKGGDVRKAARRWRLLFLKARDLPDGEEKDAAIKARNNALRTLGKSVDADMALQPDLEAQMTGAELHVSRREKSAR